MGIYRLEICINKSTAHFLHLGILVCCRDQLVGAQPSSIRHVLRIRLSTRTKVRCKSVVKTCLLENLTKFCFYHIRKSTCRRKHEIDGDRVLVAIDQREEAAVLERLAHRRLRLRLRHEHLQRRRRQRRQARVRFIEQENVRLVDVLNDGHVSPFSLFSLFSIAVTADGDASGEEIRELHDGRLMRRPDETSRSFLARRYVDLLVLDRVTGWLCFCVNRAILFETLILFRKRKQRKCSEPEHTHVDTPVRDVDSTRGHVADNASCRVQSPTNEHGRRVARELVEDDRLLLIIIIIIIVVEIELVANRSNELGDGRPIVDRHAAHDTLLAHVSTMIVADGYLSMDVITLDYCMIP